MINDLTFNPADIADRLKHLGEALRHPPPSKGFSAGQIESFYRELMDISAKLSQKSPLPHGLSFRKIRAQ